MMILITNLPLFLIWQKLFGSHFMTVLNRRMVKAVMGASTSMEWRIFILNKLVLHDEKTPVTPLIMEHIPQKALSQQTITICSGLGKFWRKSTGIQPLDLMMKLWNTLKYLFLIQVSQEQIF